MKTKKIVRFALLLTSVLALGLSSCKKCKTCNYTNSNGNKGPSFEVCGDEVENLESQSDASKYICVEA